MFEANSEYSKLILFCICLSSMKLVVLQVADGMSSVLQDFEIAGSRTGALSSADCAGGCECDSPLDTVNSWDSHSHYRQRAASPDISLYSGVIVYCDHTHLKTPTGFLRVLLLVSTFYSKNKHYHFFLRKLLEY